MKKTQSIKSVDGYYSREELESLPLEDIMYIMLNNAPPQEVLNIIRKNTLLHQIKE